MMGFKQLKLHTLDLNINKNWLLPLETSRAYVTITLTLVLHIGTFWAIECQNKYAYTGLTFVNFGQHTYNL